MGGWVKGLVQHVFFLGVHLKRDPVVFARLEPVDVIVPQRLRHGGQLSVTLDHHVLPVGPSVLCRPAELSAVGRR